MPADCGLILLTNTVNTPMSCIFFLANYYTGSVSHVSTIFRIDCRKNAAANETVNHHISTVLSVYESNRSGRHLHRAPATEAETLDNSYTELEKEDEEEEEKVE